MKFVFFLISIEVLTKEELMLLWVTIVLVVQQSECFFKVISEREISF